MICYAGAALKKEIERPIKIKDFDLFFDMF